MKRFWAWHGLAAVAYPTLAPLKIAAVRCSNVKFPFKTYLVRPEYRKKRPQSVVVVLMIGQAGVMIGFVVKVLFGFGGEGWFD